MWLLKQLQPNTLLSESPCPLSQVGHAVWQLNQTPSFSDAGWCHSHASVLF